MLATCYALIYQSTHIDDGLAEYLTFIRCTIAVAIQMGMKSMKLIFENMISNEAFEKIEPVISTLPLVEPELVEAACRSFERFRHLCQSKVEVDVYTILVGIVHSLISSCRDGKLFCP